MIPPLDTAHLHARLATVVGVENVSALASDAFYGGLLGQHVPEELRPRAVVRPATAEQLQRLAPMVAELGHGLWSSPNDCGNGAQRGHLRKPGVLVDLGRMNRIVEVDRHGAFAVLEAGVSYAQLAAELAARDLPMWLDADANAAHSVAGSVAARRWGLTPYGDHQAALCGLEAALANGSLLRTGMGALPGSDCWPRYKYNFGPALDGLFSRANFGVVTKIGLWLMPAPRRFLPFALPLPDLAGVARAVDSLRPLLLDGSLGGRVLIASRESDAVLLARAGSTATVDAGAPPWTLYAALYGLPGEIEYHGQNVAAALGGALAAGQGAVWPLRLKQLRGEPVYATPGGKDESAVSFCVLAPAAGTDALALHHGVLTRLAELGPRLDFKLAPRLVALEVDLPDDADASGDAAAAALTAIKDLLAAGYGLHSGSPALAAILAARHTPAGLRHLYDGLSSALDPYAMLATRGTFSPSKRRDGS